MKSSIDRLKMRDEAAWNDLYDRHKAELYGFVVRLVRGDRIASDDLFQEIWLQAVRRIEQFDPDRGELRGWLFGIARRQIALHWRRRSAAGHAHLAIESESGGDPIDEAILPDEIVEQLEREAVVASALLILPSDRRQVLLDKYVGGMSVDQIAMKSGKTSKAVESLLSRSREQLRSLLGWYFAHSNQKERP